MTDIVQEAEEHLSFLSNLPGVHPHRIARIREALASVAATPRINWSKPIETNETPPRSARLVGETKSTLEYFIVEIEGEDHWHPNGEYRVDKETGFIRGKLAIRNCAATPTRDEVIAECAALCDGLRRKDYSAENADWTAGTLDCATAIRSLVSRPQRAPE